MLKIIISIIYYVRTQHSFMYTTPIMSRESYNIIHFKIYISSNVCIDAMDNTKICNFIFMQSYLP